MSLGDNDFAATVYMDTDKTRVLFWVVWVLIAYFNCITFLNFIIDEASDSYERLMSNIENILKLQKLAFICESLEMLIEKLKLS